MAGCGGSDGANDERRAQEPMTNRTDAPEARATATAVALNGCVETAGGHDEFVLRNVQFPQPAGAAQAETGTAARGGITAGSSVRLDAGDQEDAVRKAVGQRVTLTGIIADAGSDTVGTSGVILPSGDRSHAASDEHYSEKVAKEAGPIARDSMADAETPEVRITAMESTGESCGSKPAARQ